MKTLERSIILLEEDNVTLELYKRELSKSFTVYAFTEIDHVFEMLDNLQNVQAVVIEPEIQSGRGWELIHSLQTKYPGRCICSNCVQYARFQLATPAKGSSRILNQTSPSEHIARKNDQSD